MNKIEKLVLKYMVAYIERKNIYHNGEFIYIKDFEKADEINERYLNTKKELRNALSFFDYYILFYLMRDVFYKKYNLKIPLI